MFLFAPDKHHTRQAVLFFDAVLNGEKPSSTFCQR